MKEKIVDGKLIMLVSEFCPVDHYTCLMPIEYERTDPADDSIGKKEYRKSRYACHNVLDGKCDKCRECAHYMAAEELIYR